MIRAKINGIEGEFAEGASVLEAARQMGSDIPTLCDDKRLDPVGACRMCLVEIKGRANATVSCTTILADGMEIETHTEPIESARKWNLRMLARNYPADAFTKYPDKPFHKLATDFGLTAADFHGDHSISADPSHTYIDVDMSRCINCYACARICADVQGQFVWHVLGRGEDSHIMPDSFGAFGDSTCVSCGACADACPTGALEDKTVIERGFPTAWTKTTCPYCGTGCEMNVGTRDDRVVQVKPVMDAPVNYGHLCVKGRYAFDFVDADDRVTEPMIRESGDWRVVSWEEAIRYTADKLKAIDAEFGKESIAVLGSARATNEENYLAQKFTRVVLGTNNVDCCARVCHTPSAAAMKMMIGTGAMTNSFDDIEKARTIILCGANPSENHPIPGARIKQAVIKNGTKLIVIDPRKTELTKYADVHLQLRPGTNILMFNAIAHAIIDEGLTDPEFIATRVEEFEEFKSFVAEYSPEAVAERCGVDAELIRKAARIYATDTPSMAMHGLGMTEHLQGTEGVMTIVNLALLTGNIGKAGAGVNPLRGQNNVQGSAHMGCDPGILTGSITIEAGRELFESVWKTPIPTAAGLNQLQMIDAAREGELKALWTIGYDVFLSNANAHETAKAFANMDLVIIQDFFMNETAKRFGHVFFPAVTSFEKDGTFMNGERRVQRIRGAVSPRGNSRSDWEIVCDLAAAMGFEKDFAFNSAEEIWNEVRAVWPPGYGITYERIEKAGIQWPCPDIEHPGTEILHGESFSNGVKAALRRIKFRATKEVISDDFPFLLTTGRVLEHFNAGTMTMRTPNHELRPTDLLMVSKADSHRLSIAAGEKVRLRSNYGETVLPVEITDKVKAGELFASFHDPAVFLNYATGPTRDRFTQAPEFKVTAVSIEKLDSQISSN
ncbi:MAG TPA: formate dehydrogenase subunit alpha [Pyrinomonadaceae bacterium]|nr:formate dehydrogenase subunit alpha [Pyrinomonadaceae bacterium]